MNDRQREAYDYGSNAGREVRGFLAALFLLLLGLKLSGAADLSWWAVLAPLYGPFALGVAGLLGLAALGAARRRAHERKARELAALLERERKSL